MLTKKITLGPEKKGKVTTELLKLLKETNIYQNRTGMGSHDRQREYTDRLKINDIISVRVGSQLEAYSTIASGNSLFSIGSFASIASGLPSNTTVGRYSCIAPRVAVMGFRHPIGAICLNSAVFNKNRENVSAYIRDIEVSGTTFEFNSVPTPQGKQNISIGNDVWIGSDVLLSKGITIGNGAIIAARSIVTKDVPPYAIVGGAPAKILKWRFPTEICQRLDSSNWWNYHLKDLHKLSMNEPEKFVDEIENKTCELELFNPTAISSEQILETLILL